MKSAFDIRRAVLLGTLIAALPLVNGCQTAEDQAATARSLEAQANMDAPAVSYSSLHIKPRVSIAVMPFEVVDYVTQTRDFEKAFFAANLVKTLRNSPVGKKVVFAPSETPAVDYVIRGTSRPGTDEIPTSIKVEDITGRLLWQGPFTDADWGIIANRIIKEISVDADPLTEVDKKRVAKYSEGMVSEPTEKSFVIAGVAANVEREKLLSRFTELALANAADYGKIYENLREQRQELARQAAEEDRRQTASMLGGLAAGLGGISAAASGNQAGVTQAQMRMSQAQVEVAASGNRQLSIEQASQKLSESFGAAVTPTSITFMDKVYELSGSYEEQLTEFRKMVKQSLADSAVMRANNQ